MDCNNYSYVNYSGKTNVIASGRNGEVEFTAERNWFGDEYYYVSDIMGDFAETYSMEYGYPAAVKAFNSLVPESDRIYPLF